jgi:hypothetical protein
MAESNPEPDLRRTAAAVPERHGPKAPERPKLSA